MKTFNGLGMNLGNLSWLSNAVTRSVSPENPTGDKGCGGMATEGTGAACASALGRGWKISPSVIIPPGESHTLANLEGPGAIQQMWLTPAGIPWRFAILRIYWDGQEQPSVECPLGDFFGAGWGEYIPLSSLPVCVNPGSAFNCYWEMPFQKQCRMTITNIDPKNPLVLYYQVNYVLTEVPKECGYFHAQFRRSNPVKYKELHTILDGVSGQGHYVGTTMNIGVNNNGWWGEGEIKFYLDGDREFPTICGTGTEDYFCGSYCFENKRAHRYESYSTPYAGFHVVGSPDALHRAGQRFCMYRWHIVDPVRFAQNIRVDIQDLGWRHYSKYLPRQDDIATVAYWYQTLPTAPFPVLPDRDDLEILL